MEALALSLLVVAVGEIGDKTQFLALMLAARFRRPAPIVLGIAVATLFNHTLAGVVGAWVRHVVPEVYLRWLVGASFLAVALWSLKPDVGDDAAPVEIGRVGVFMVTTASFFLAEMGDKTQVATVLLAAQFSNLAAVVAGTTIGMLIADIPVVLAGHAASAKIPFKLVRRITAALFIALAAASVLAPSFH